MILDDHDVLAFMSLRYAMRLDIVNKRVAVADVAKRMYEASEAVWCGHHGTKAADWGSLPARERNDWMELAERLFRGAFPTCR